MWNQLLFLKPGKGCIDMPLVLIDRRIQKLFTPMDSFFKIVLECELHQIVISTDREIPVCLNKISEASLVLGERAFRSPGLDEIPEILVKKKLDRVLFFNELLLGFFTTRFNEPFLVSEMQQLNILFT